MNIKLNMFTIYSKQALKCFRSVLMDKMGAKQSATYNNPLAYKNQFGRNLFLNSKVILLKDSQFFSSMKHNRPDT